jgi:hypothetical protein
MLGMNKINVENKNARVEYFVPEYVKNEGGLMSEGILIIRESETNRLPEPSCEVRLLGKKVRLVASGYHNAYKENTVIIQSEENGWSSTFLPKSQAEDKYGQDVIAQLFKYYVASKSD